MLVCAQRCEQECSMALLDQLKIGNNASVHQQFKLWHIYTTEHITMKSTRAMYNNMHESSKLHTVYKQSRHTVQAGFHLYKVKKLAHQIYGVRSQDSGYFQEDGAVVIQREREGYFQTGW